MAFGQSSGPPATGQQLRELLELLVAAGHTDFRDARGPMGFTQRQAAGKFTRDEADEFIERLQAEVFGEGPPVGSHASTPTVRPTPTPTRRPVSEIALDEVPVELLAAELQRRGWVVLQP